VPVVQAGGSMMTLRFREFVVLCLQIMMMSLFGYKE
jgi:hypothetical protein